MPTSQSVSVRNRGNAHAPIKPSPVSDHFPFSWSDVVVLSPFSGGHPPADDHFLWRENKHRFLSIYCKMTDVMCIVLPEPLAYSDIQVSGAHRPTGRPGK